MGLRVSTSALGSEISCLAMMTSLLDSVASSCRSSASSSNFRSNSFNIAASSRSWSRSTVMLFDVAVAVSSPGGNRSRSPDTFSSSELVLDICAAFCQGWRPVLRLVL